MAIDSSQIDLNSEAILFDRENDVVGMKSSVSNVSAGVSGSETLSADPVSGGEFVVHDRVCQVGDDRGVNGSMEVLSRVNHGCDVMINGNGKEGLGVLLGVGSGLEEGVEVADGRCDKKEGVFLCGVVKNEDEKSRIEFSDGVLFAYGGAECDGGLVIEFNDGFQSELECENARDVTGKDLPRVEVVTNNVAQGGGNNEADCGKEVNNDALVNLSAVVKDDGERNAADSLVTKDGFGCATEVATYQVQDAILCKEVEDVNAEESLHMKDLSRNCLDLEPSCELKQIAYPIDAQVDVMQNQTMVVDVAEGQMFDTSQKECHDFNLVVDLDSYGNMPEVGVYWEAVSEFNFYASDLVWGKVMGHPWWPGQIFDASAASVKAKRHLREDCYLVAYFGDETFAWNDVSMIKPFQMHFSQMEKQSNLENFHHAVDCALDEISRRVEFGLSCPCIPEDVFFKLKTQVISNAGVKNKFSRRNEGGCLINAMSFEPRKLVNYVKSLGLSPLVESERLAFVTARAQLSAFYRSKGYSQLPEFTWLGGLFENDMETPLMKKKEQCDHQTHVGYSLQDGDSKRRSKKHKLLSDLMSEKGFCILNNEHTAEQEAKSVPGRRGRKRKAAYNTSKDYLRDSQSRRFTQSQQASINEMMSQLCLAAQDPIEQKAKSVPGRRGRKKKIAYNTSEDYLRDSQNRRFTQSQHASINEMMSQLCLVAQDPIGGSCSSVMVSFFAEFRNSISHDCSASLVHEMSLEQMYDGETGVTSITGLASTTSAMEPCNDSYWTDRIIQSFSETLTEANPLSFKSKPASDLGFKQQDTDLGSGSSKLVEYLDESSKEGFCPTALTLKFTSLNSVPSTTDLNKIFGRFGPLIESKTELLEKTNKARVIFQRRSDAETAFSSAGKYSIFGPSLVSYRLRILPRKQQKGTEKRGRKRKETSSLDGAAV
ncbi:hypothetical protein VNO78_22141 [Psophocarpus tetragonolobus]|uniref:PWWP domain-containing protein n=1 Tax=Psophocarpus tetragonolobus TaxID=3891 RepID=A0AAN9SC17_PSOTE